MDTGGYTGDWGPSEGISDAKNGKMAILHSKELVLNADDTENILDAVNIMRALVSPGAIHLNEISASRVSDTIEQRVEVNATFPGVTTIADIEQALTHIADNAYQYAAKN